MNNPLAEAVASVPAGTWSVGVSGGADSVALLSLLRHRPELSLVVVHLDHQTRGGGSAKDAAFVAELAARWALPCVVRRREEVESQASLDTTPADSTLTTHRSPLANLSARFRAARLDLFRQVVNERKLSGVILAHHADDQAETVLHRLLRGSGVTGLAGMSPRATIGGLVVLRPLLRVSSAALREHLGATGQGWREDPSNKSSRYLRNRLRRVLARHAELKHDVLSLGEACGELRHWINAHAPKLEARFRTSDVDHLPPLLLSASLRRWLAERGVGRNQITPAVVWRLMEMVQDAAAPARQHFPAGLLVRRRAGWISTDL